MRVCTLTANLESKEMSPFRMSRKKYKKIEEYIKRFSDVVFSMLALAIFSPLMLFIAIVVKLQDGGPIIYRQRRVTKDGKLFWIYKFRSMRINSEKHGAVLATEHDSRCTRFGRRLRDTHLDELPQLINVIKGDMSLVGPRPERPELIRLIRKEVPGFDRRLQVKAGLTGYAQVYGDYEIESDEKLRYDLYYIQHFSLLLDMKILLLTFGKVMNEII